MTAPHACRTSIRPATTRAAVLPVSAVLYATSAATPLDTPPARRRPRRETHASGGLSASAPSRASQLRDAHSPGLPAKASRPRPPAFHVRPLPRPPSRPRRKRAAVPTTSCPRCSRRRKRVRIVLGGQEAGQWRGRPHQRGVAAHRACPTGPTPPSSSRRDGCISSGRRSVHWQVLSPRRAPDGLGGSTHLAVTTRLPAPCSTLVFGSVRTVSFMRSAYRWAFYPPLRVSEDSGSTM